MLSNALKILRMRFPGRHLRAKLSPRQSRRPRIQDHLHRALEMISLKVVVCADAKMCCVIRTRGSVSSVRRRLSRIIVKTRAEASHTMCAVNTMVPLTCLFLSLCITNKSSPISTCRVTKGFHLPSLLTQVVGMCTTCMGMVMLKIHV